MKFSDSTLYNANLLKFICLGWFSSFALKVISLTVGWQIYTKTGSPLALGLIGLIQFAPQFFLILPAGVLADKYDRKRIRKKEHVPGITDLRFFLSPLSRG